MDLHRTAIRRPFLIPANNRPTIRLGIDRIQSQVKITPALEDLALVAKQPVQQAAQTLNIRSLVNHPIPELSLGQK